MGFRQEAKKASVLAAKLRNRERVKPGTVEWEYKIRKEFVKNTENTSSRKVIANTERTTERFSRRKLSWKVQGKGKIGRAHVELQSHSDLVCRLLLEKKKKKKIQKKKQKK